MATKLTSFLLCIPAKPKNYASDNVFIFLVNFHQKNLKIIANPSTSPSALKNQCSQPVKQVTQNDYESDQTKPDSCFFSCSFFPFSERVEEIGELPRTC